MDSAVKFLPNVHDQKVNVAILIFDMYRPR